MPVRPFPYYTGGNKRQAGDGGNNGAPIGPAELPGSRRSQLNDESQYKPDPGLANAVNAALLLGQPLLLTGEPGTGKTQLAYSISHDLGWGKPLVFETKSSSTARDLFYTYDTLSRFHAAQTKTGSQRNEDYITYNALGLAILYALEESEVSGWVPAGFVHGGRRRSVVLIDEIDKAPRDFPNDILNEVEHMYFRVPELGNKEFRVVEDNKRPVLILTSNSEKHLPDAFLRRCVYYHIPFPDKTRLKEIVTARIGQFAENSPLLNDALDLFLKLRALEGLDKKPATAELLMWLLYLMERGAQGGDSLHKHRALVRESVGVLVKSKGDQLAAQEIAKEVLGEDRNVGAAVRA